MRTSLSDAARPAYFTIRQAVWILGGDPATVSRAIRLGILRTTRQNGRLVVSAGGVLRLLGDRADQVGGGS